MERVSSTITTIDMITPPLFILLLSIVAVASGLVGVFALMRRMTLAADSMSHVALPGIGIAMLLKINPVLGAGVALFFGAWLVWTLERRTSISTDAIVGVLFSASLALGSLFAGGEELLDALFGTIVAIPLFQWAIGMAAAFGIILFIFYYRDRLTLALVSEDLATASGISVSRMNLLFLLIFALDILLGLQFLGALLMGSLIIVPAAVGRNLGESLSQTMAISIAVSLFSVLAGYIVATTYGFAFGPVVITIAAACFVASFLVKRGA